MRRLTSGYARISSRFQCSSSRDSWGVQRRPIGAEARFWHLRLHLVQRLRHFTHVRRDQRVRGGASGERMHARQQFIRDHSSRIYASARATSRSMPVDSAMVSGVPFAIRMRRDSPFTNGIV